MNYLLDTNVLSELVRKAPDAGVTQWLAARPADSLCLSALTLGEIRKGVELAPDQIRRQRLREWLDEELSVWFGGRILAVDAAVADCWGRLLATAGRPLPSIDSLLAATAMHHDLVLVTRNVRDFEGLPIRVFSPWAVTTDI